MQGATSCVWDCTDYVFKFHWWRLYKQQMCFMGKWNTIGWYRCFCRDSILDRYKIIQTFSSVAVTNLAYLPFRKAWLVPEELQIEVSSRCHQGIISNNWSNWLFFGNVIRPASGLKRLQLLKRLPKEFQFALFPGDGWAMGKADFGDLLGSFSWFKPWAPKTWQWQIFGLHWCNVEVYLVFIYVLEPEKTDWLGFIGGYTVILSWVYRDHDSLSWESLLQ